MARSPVTVSKEGDATSAVEETVPFDDDTLRAIAEVYKNQGNEEFNKNNFNNAIDFYTEGIKVNCNDDEMKAKMYSNRAAAHFNLGKYTEARSGAKTSIGLQPSFLKAFVRGASACVRLKDFNEAIRWCNNGLTIDPNNQKLLELRNKSVREQRKPQESHGEKKTGKEAKYTAKNLSPYNKSDNFENKKGVAKACSSLGDPQGNLKTFTDYTERQLRKNELGDKSREEATYCSLGNTPYSLGLQCVSAVTDRFSLLAGQQTYQFLMLGLEGAGKTTFLYKLRINGYKKDDVKKDMKFLKKDKKDPGYHFEEFSSPSIGQYGIWEVPGDDVLRPMWPMFYRYLHIHCVIFVVDAFSPDCFDLTKENFHRLSKARDCLFHLLNEDELRVSVFFLVLNVDRNTEDATRNEEEEQNDNALFEMLGVPEIEQMAHLKTRFRKVVMNCANITRKDSNWENMLKEFRKMQVQIQGEI